MWRKMGGTGWFYHDNFGKTWGFDLEKILIVGGSTSKDGGLMNKNEEKLWWNIKDWSDLGIISKNELI